GGSSSLEGRVEHGFQGPSCFGALPGRSVALVSAADGMDDYKAKDTRRFNLDGTPRATERPDGLATFSFKSIEDPIARTFHYLRAQIRWHRVPQIPFWFQISGLLTSARLIYVGIVSLQADRRPKRLVIPASIL